MSVWQCALLAGIGFAGGVAVGSGFVAFITVLDIVPRLAQLSKTPIGFTLTNMQLSQVP